MPNSLFDLFSNITNKNLPRRIREEAFVNLCIISFFGFVLLFVIVVFLFNVFTYSPKTVF